jgi:16S rRNA (uracil1498-N3)-methyltransferase
LPFADWLSTAPAAGGEPLALCIGPEGGFSDEECEQFRLKGAAQVTLGPHVLRVETAAVAATAAWSMAAR